MSRDPFEETSAPEHGPEWWALGLEFCKCGHHYDGHLIQSPKPGEFVKGACIVPGCDCRKFDPLDNQ